MNDLKMRFKLLLTVSLLVNCTLAYLLLRPEDTDRTPPWHPFEVNSKLTLESIVDNGYSFLDMSCGYVQYAKQVGDTTIQYGVEIDCNSYGPSIWEIIFGRKENASPLGHFDDLEENAEEVIDDPSVNKYFPWIYKEVKLCRQKIESRYFTISLGSTIDSIFIRHYIRSKGGYILENTEKWDSINGGSFMVGHEESHLYFCCSVYDRRIGEEDTHDWVFGVSGYIPPLDQGMMEEEAAWRKKIDAYYSR